YVLSTVQQLDEDFLQTLAPEDYSIYVFLDIGSGQLSLVHKYLKDKTVIILDHHEIDNGHNCHDWDSLHHLNPHLVTINGSSEISGAGVVYHFIKALDPAHKNMAHIALLGAIGDIQEVNGFSDINTSILQDAVEAGKIKHITGLRLFGVQTKPLHKVLEYTTDPYIPGVSGSETGAIQFLQELGINPRIGDNGWRKLIHLSDDELKRLVTGIILKRQDEKKPEDVLGSVYLLTEEPRESPTRDAREYSTLLNACGRMDKAYLGIGTCLGDPKLKRDALSCLTSYKKEIIASLRWYEENQDSPSVIRTPEYLILNTGTEVRHTVIGTLASIVSRSDKLNEGMLILSLGRTPKGDTKVSLRLGGRNNNDINLRNVVDTMITTLGTGEAGGHMNAAGALIPAEREADFIAIAQEVMRKIAVEEIVK
ncbi:hypothetical protein COY95_04220, partial [Candidatus Woesearchaeota archaeon CG_4_10_14_0_8_um_filter_47_5]